MAKRPKKESIKKIPSILLLTHFINPNNGRKYHSGIT